MTGRVVRWFRAWRLYRSHLGDYMLRWILATPWGTVRLHKLLRSDEDRDLHDHPWDFTSVILSHHGYYEVTPAGVWQYRRWELNRKRAEDTHRLVLFKPVWTLVFTGPKRRAWGFHTPEGWVHHRCYLGRR